MHPAIITASSNKPLSFNPASESNFASGIGTQD